MILLDASVVLGYLNNEPGKESIESVLLTGEACISVVNLTEVISKLCDWGMRWETAKETFDKLALKLEPFTVETSLETARLRPLTRELGLSLGDRACLATASLRHYPVLTGDRPWLHAAQALGLDIKIFRPPAH